MGKIRNNELRNFLRSDEFPLSLTVLDLNEIYKKLLDANFKYIRFENSQIPLIVNLIKSFYPDKFKEKGIKYNQVMEFDLEKFKKETGYELHEIKTKKEFEKFKKYYQQDEILCSFNNIDDRLNRYKNVFLVHKNWENAKRSKDRDPYDEYSLSVLLLQNPKYEQDRAQIISRYNHNVKGNRPNDLYDFIFDKIYPGLSFFMGQIVSEVMEKSRKSGENLGGDYKIINNKIYKRIKEKDGRVIYNAGYEYWINKTNILINPDYQKIIKDDYVYDYKNKEILEVTADGLKSVVKDVNEKDIVAEDVDTDKFHLLNENRIVLGNLILDNFKKINRKICRHIVGDVYLNALTTATTKLFDSADGYVYLDYLTTATTKLFDSAGWGVDLRRLTAATTKLFDSVGGYVCLNSLTTANTKLFDSAGLDSLTTTTKLIDCVLNF